MIRFDNIPPEVMQALCTPMHLVLPSTPAPIPVHQSWPSHHSAHHLHSSSHHSSSHHPSSHHPSLPPIGALFLGSLSALSEPAVLRANNITHLIQVLDVPWLPPLEEQGFTCYKLKIDDTEDEGRVDLRKYLSDVTGYIDGVLRGGGSVLVHCQQGISRSPAIIIAFLMRFRGMSYESAYAFTRRCRACIKPNAAFVRALRDWEGVVGTGTGAPPLPRPAPGHGGQGGGGGGGSGYGGGGGGAHRQATV